MALKIDRLNQVIQPQAPFRHSTEADCGLSSVEYFEYLSVRRSETAFPRFSLKELRSGKGKQSGNLRATLRSRVFPY
jgi:hypothetical protein